MRKCAGFLRTRRGRAAALVTIAVGLAGGSYYVRATQVMPQATIHLLQDVVLPEAGQKVLIFSPHPDDETIAAGGYIRESVLRKAVLRIVLVTDGNKHGLEARRYQEFSDATATLGVPRGGRIFLGYPDGRLKRQSRAALVRRLKQQVDAFDPEIVIYPHPADEHPDHAVTGDVVHEVLEDDSRHRIQYRYLVHHARFPQPKRLRPRLYLLPPVSTVTFDYSWQRLLLPEGVESRKASALHCYRSQLRVPLLRSLLLSCIRRNELFSVAAQADDTTPARRPTTEDVSR